MVDSGKNMNTNNQNKASARINSSGLQVPVQYNRSFSNTKMQESVRCSIRDMSNRVVPMTSEMEYAQRSSKRRMILEAPQIEDLEYAQQKITMNPYQRLKNSEKRLGKRKRINETDDYFDKLRLQFPTLIESQGDEIKRLQYHCLNDAKEKPNYDISSDECVENATVFQFLLFKQRMRHMEAMWRKAFVKAKAAGQFIKFIRDIQDKIYLLGIGYNIKDLKEHQHIPCAVIPPDSRFSHIWSLTIAVLLIYTATYMPFKTCFVDESSSTDEMIDWTVDVLFMVDILVNFLQATEEADGTWIVSPKQIARKYLKSWFAFDLVSVIPFNLIEKFFDKDPGGGSESQSYNQLIRLARLPRLYRMTKLMRLFKVIKSAKRIKWVQRILKSIKVNSAIQRMIQGMITAVLLTHIFACFWFLTAKFHNFSDDTWVARLGLRGRPATVHYVWALHWATQTITTVGYGDIPAFTNTEIIFSFIWMLVGVAFYSFIIGNFSSILTGSSQVQKSIQYRVQGLSELARKAQIPFDTSKQIKQYIEANVMAFITQDEDQQLIQTLPPCLRDEILLITYGEMIDRIDFLKTVEDHEFMWKLLQSLVDIRFNKGDVLYWRGDDSDAMYFVLTGKVKLYTDGNPFIKYQNGECFGDQDMLLNLPRDSKAVAITHLHLKALNGEMFEQISQHAQETCLKMIVNARAKRDKHFYLIRKLNERLSRKNIIIEEGGGSGNNQSQSKTAEVKSNEVGNSKNSSPGLYASLGRASSNRSLLLSPSVNGDGNPVRPSSPPMLRINSEQIVSASRQNLMNFKMNPMATIQESDAGSKSSRRASSYSRASVVPMEFAGQGEANGAPLPRSKTPMKGGTSIGTFSSLANSLVKSKPSIQSKRRGTMLSVGPGMGGGKGLGRKHLEINRRLELLSQMNDNRKSQVESQNISSTLKDKLWKQYVPIVSEADLDQNTQKFCKSLGKGTDDAISERVDDEDSVAGSQKPNIEILLEDQTEKYVTPTKQIPDQKEDEKSKRSDASKVDHDKLDGTEKDQKISRMEHENMVSFKEQKGFSNLSIRTKQGGVDQAHVFNEKTLIAAKQMSSPSTHPSPQFGKKGTPSNCNTPKSGSTLTVFSRRNSYINSVQTRVSLNSSQLNEALQVSSRVKLANQQRQLTQLSMRVKKQGLDQLGNKHSYFSQSSDAAESQEEETTFGKESKELESKIEALKQLELEEIHEDEEEEDDEEAAESGRRTLLDKVVGDVFGKNKQNLYEMFPSLAVITVPKMPIITPKGDEIILRKKYNNNMNLLNEAFEQKKELFDSEQMLNQEQSQQSALHQSASKQSSAGKDAPSSVSPTIESQTPMHQRRSQMSDLSPNASGNWPSRGMVGGSRKESGDASDFGAAAKKPPRAHHSHKKCNEAAVEGTNSSSIKPRGSASNLPSAAKNKSMAITVAIEELGEENIVKRTKSYMTEKQHQYESPEKSTPEKSTTRNKDDNINLLDVKNLNSHRSKCSSLSLNLEIPNDATAIQASFHSHNGKLKSKSELRREFVSPAVMDRLKRASLHLDQDQKAKRKVEAAAPGPVDKQASVESAGGSPEVTCKKFHSDLTVMNLNNSSSAPGEESKDNANLSKTVLSRVTSGLVSMEDGDMSEVLSSNADVRPTSQTPNSSTESTQWKQNDLDMAHRFEILKLLKDFIDKDEGNHVCSPHSKDVLKLFSNNAEEELGSDRRPSARILYIGNESMKSIVRYNSDSYLLGLNTFEVISMFDHVQQAMTGMKKKLVKINQHIQSVEKKQAKLDTNADKMIEKMKAYRELKKEVANLNRTQMRDQRNSKEPRNMKARRGQGKMQGQSGATITLNTSNQNLQKQDSQVDGLTLSQVANDIPETSSLPVQQPAESSLALAQHEVQTHQTFPFGSPSKLQQQVAAKQVITAHKRDNLLQVASVEEMSAETIAKIVNRPPKNL